MLQITVVEFYRVCNKKKILSMSEGICWQCKVCEVATIDFAKPYRVRTESKKCKTWIEEEMKEEVSEFKYFKTVTCKNESIEGKVRERALKGDM